VDLLGVVTAAAAPPPPADVASHHSLVGTGMSVAEPQGNGGPTHGLLHAGFWHLGIAPSQAEPVPPVPPEGVVAEWLAWVPFEGDAPPWVIQQRVVLTRVNTVLGPVDEKAVLTIVAVLVLLLTVES